MDEDLVRRRTKAFAFVIAGGFFAATGFPVQDSLYGIVDPWGLQLLAHVLVFVAFGILAITVFRQDLAMREAIGVGLIIWLVCAAISEAGVGGIRWLLPLPVVALAVWPYRPLPIEGFAARFPDLARQLAAILLAILGADMLTTGLDHFRLLSGRFDYFGLFFGGIAYSLALASLLVPLSRLIAPRIAIAAYTACLALYSLTVIGTMASTVAPKDIVRFLVVAMLLFQAWRHFTRPDGWLKLVETLIGGLLLSIGAEALVDLFGPGNRWVILGLLFAPLAGLVAALGLYLIWTDEIWLLRFRYRRGGHTQA